MAAAPYAWSEQSASGKQSLYPSNQATYDETDSYWSYGTQPPVDASSRGELWPTAPAVYEDQPIHALHPVDTKQAPSDLYSTPRLPLALSHPWNATYSARSPIASQLSHSSNAVFPQYASLPASNFQEEYASALSPAHLQDATYGWEKEVEYSEGQQSELDSGSYFDGQTALLQAQSYGMSPSEIDYASHLSPPSVPLPESPALANLHIRSPFISNAYIPPAQPEVVLPASEVSGSKPSMHRRGGMSLSLDSIDTFDGNLFTQPQPTYTLSPLTKPPTTHFNYDTNSASTSTGHPKLLSALSSAKDSASRRVKGAYKKLPTHQKAYACTQCDQSFNRNHDLKRHLRIHMDIKPFPCGWCDKQFTRKDALKRHLLVRDCGQGLGQLRAHSELGISDAPAAIAYHKAESEAEGFLTPRPKRKKTEVLASGMDDLLAPALAKELAANQSSSSLTRPGPQPVVPPTSSAPAVSRSVPVHSSSLRHAYSAPTSFEAPPIQPPTSGNSDHMAPMYRPQSSRLQAETYQQHLRHSTAPGFLQSPSQSAESTSTGSSSNSSIFTSFGSSSSAATSLSNGVSYSSCSLPSSPWHPTHSDSFFAQQQQQQQQQQQGMESPQWQPQHHTSTTGSNYKLTPASPALNPYSNECPPYLLATSPFQQQHNQEMNALSEKLQGGLPLNGRYEYSYPVEEDGSYFH